MSFISISLQSAMKSIIPATFSRSLSLSPCKTSHPNMVSVRRRSSWCKPSGLRLAMSPPEFPTSPSREPSEMPDIPTPPDVIPETPPNSPGPDFPDPPLSPPEMPEIPLPPPDLVPPPLPPPDVVPPLWPPEHDPRRAPEIVPPPSVPPHVVQ